MTRRGILILLLSLVIGVPVLLELWTLAEMFQQGLMSADTPARRRTLKEEEGSHRGSEILAQSAPTETIVDLGVYVPGEQDEDREGWVFHLRVSVDNPTTKTYRLRLDSLTLSDGSTVKGGAEGTVPPGRHERVSGRWIIPEGTTPTRIRATGTLLSADGAPARVTTETLTFGKIPVQASKETEETP